MAGLQTGRNVIVLGSESEKIKGSVQAALAGNGADHVDWIRQQIAVEIP